MRRPSVEQGVGKRLSRSPELLPTSRRAGEIALLGAFAIAGGHALAQNRSQALPDAQVESSVLQALARDTSLAGQQISSTTVYGVVTLSGHVPDEATRSRAEDVVARTPGVSKVVDELVLGAAPPDSQGTASPSDAGAVAASPDATVSQGGGGVLQSDGTYVTADPEGGATGDAAAAPSAPVQQGAAAQASGGVGPTVAQGQSETQPSYAPGPYENQPSQPGYGQGSYPQGSPYGQAPYEQQNPGGGEGAYGPARTNPGYGGQYGMQGRQGQQGGVQLNVPAGAVLQLRVDQPIDSRRSPVGSSFTGVLQQDVVIGGYVALPRGAVFQGTVVDATNAGALKGRAELGLALTQVTLGGQIYPLTTNLWSQAGGDKAVRTVNSALGLGVLGAIVGGVAGGGAGAAIGAGVGGAAGLGASAASGGGAVIVPPESLLTFRLSQPLEVTTVSQAELNRLAFNAPPAGAARMVRRYPAYGPYGPGYYPRYYRPYPF